ncbi:hypothetical protein BC938DRAFT_475242 [Jimgerdemannia flammicorona]|uniref:Uncharacterized protein n=1 Tax=Jimgerdemannia flammicorona TaxID=994334 RepID=A0A433QRS9_9FUNG|nr:hypothetical protein BC938DRAFT_475242 [Jimgerdemannia flammicorona]
MDHGHPAPTSNGYGQAPPERRSTQHAQPVNRTERIEDAPKKRTGRHQNQAATNELGHHIDTIDSASRFPAQPVLPGEPYTTRHYVDNP